MTAGIGYSGAFATSIDSGGAVGLDTGYIRDCKVSWLSVTQVQIATGVCRSDDDTTDMQVSGVLTADITVTGANGRNVDTVESANKWYAVFVIKNIATGAIAGFLVNEDDLLTFTWPVGYSKKRRVGWIRNNALSDLRNGIYFGVGSFRPFFYRVERPELLALYHGSMTIFTSFDASEWIPPTLRCIKLVVLFYCGAESQYWLRPTGSVATDTINRVLQTPEHATYFQDIEVSALGSIDYQVLAGGNELTIWAQGYIDEI